MTNQQIATEKEILLAIETLKLILIEVSNNTYELETVHRTIDILIKKIN